MYYKGPSGISFKYTHIAKNSFAKPATNPENKFLFIVNDKKRQEVMCQSTDFCYVRYKCVCVMTLVRYDCCYLCYFRLRIYDQNIIEIYFKDSNDFYSLFLTFSIEILNSAIKAKRHKSRFCDANNKIIERNESKINGIFFLDYLFIRRQNVLFFVV